MPELSVIVPAWNAEKTLALCLEGLMRQTLAKEYYEIIVVDDGSTDRTGEIARRFPVVYHYQENQGPAKARNVGVFLAQGELIFFTDADCVPDPDWLEEMAAPFAQADVVAVKGAYRTEQQSIIARFAQIEFEERFSMLERRKSIDMVDTYSAGFRKDVFVRLGGFDTRFPRANNEDTEFSYRMALLGYMMVFTPRALVRHLNHPNSVLRYFRLKFSRGYWRLAVYRIIPKKIMKDSYTPQALKLQIVVLFLGIISPFVLLVSPCSGITLLFSSLLFFLLLSFPFFRIAYKHNKTVACLTPLLLALRAVAIGSGVLWGLIHWLWNWLWKGDGAA